MCGKTHTHRIERERQREMEPEPEKDRDKEIQRQREEPSVGTVPFHFTIFLKKSNSLEVVVLSGCLLVQDCPVTTNTVVTLFRRMFGVTYSVPDTDLVTGLGRKKEDFWFCAGQLISQSLNSLVHVP